MRLEPYLRPSPVLSTGASSLGGVPGSFNIEYCQTHRHSKRFTRYFSVLSENGRGVHVTDVPC